VNDGKSALVISPTHNEGERVTGRVRERLKAAGRLGNNERKFLRLKNLQWTEAQRADSRNYQTGFVVQFHQNAPGFRRAERVTVAGQDGHSRVLVEREDGQTVPLPMDKAARFQVYESRNIVLAAGDMVRITQNSFTKDNQRLNNGDLKQVKGFTNEGDIKLANGWVIPKDHGNLTHGYCVTSYGSQSKGVDRVFVAESSESFRAADRQQFYVSASRFKQVLTIYTDDKRQLLDAVSKSSERPSATDLVEGDFRTVRPLRQTRPLRRARFAPVQQFAQAAEQVRRRLGEVFKPKNFPAETIAPTIVEIPRRGHIVEPPPQPQRRSRGISH
jgi:hypothetical protein